MKVKILNLKLQCSGPTNIDCLELFAEDFKYTSHTVTFDIFTKFKGTLKYYDLDGKAYS